jgi:hypothetical protein
MVALITIVSTLLAASTSQAARIPNAHRSLSHRDTVPEGWITPIMESYDAYHTRYMALHCGDKHDTDFFDDCCHPMKINETLADARKPECNPANAATTSAAPASTKISTGDDDDDGEDCDDDGEDGADDDDGDDDATTIASVPIATPTPTPSKMKTSKISKPTSTAAPITSAAPETTAVAATTEVKPTTTPKATPTTPAPSPKPTTSAASSSGGDSGSSSGGDWISGGKGTFFFQEGGAGSCGVYNKDSTPLVAVDIASMKPSLCGKSVLITNVANGKSVKAIVQDTCPGCANANSLDLSTGAFNQIADPATGIIDIKYKFVD